MTTTAKVFKNGRSQAVRLPREFRFEGDRVRVRRTRPPGHRALHAGRSAAASHAAASRVR